MKWSLGIAVVVTLAGLASAQSATNKRATHGTTYYEKQHRTRMDAPVQKASGSSQATGKQLGQLERQMDRTVARSTQTRTRPVTASASKPSTSSAAGHNPPINFQYHASKSSNRTAGKASGRGRSVKLH
ncbi:MAG TPA: hypothetical protein VGF08_08645 [Terriglobales bacterium]|jgi:hypothetical protein